MPWGIPSFPIPFLRHSKEARELMDGPALDVVLFERLPEMQLHQVTLSSEMWQLKQEWLKTGKPWPKFSTIEGPAHLAGRAGRPDRAAGGRPHGPRRADPGGLRHDAASWAGRCAFALRRATGARRTTAAACANRCRCSARAPVYSSYATHDPATQPHELRQERPHRQQHRLLLPVQALQDRRTAARPVDACAAQRPVTLDVPKGASGRPCSTAWTIAASASDSERRKGDLHRSARRRATCAA